LNAYEAKRNVEKEANAARIQKLLRERDALSDQREKLPLTERAAVTERVPASAGDRGNAWAGKKAARTRRKLGTTGGELL
jgi:hypothetical protein